MERDTCVQSIQQLKFKKGFGEFRCCIWKELGLHSATLQNLCEMSSSFANANSTRDVSAD